MEDVVEHRYSYEIAPESATIEIGDTQTLLLLVIPLTNVRKNCCVFMYICKNQKIILFLMTLKELENQYASLNQESVKGFLKSIQSCYLSKDINILALLGFLERILSEFRPEGYRICAHRGQISSQDRDSITIHGKIVAAMMVILQQTKSYAGLRNKTLLFWAYSAAVVKTMYDFVVFYIDSLCYRIIETGLSWRTIQEAESLDVVSYALASGIRFDKDRSDYFAFTGKGKVECRDGRFRISSSDVMEAGNQAFSLFGDKLTVVTRNTREERLKSSSQNDVESLSLFADTFIQTQDSFSKERSRKSELKTGDEANIKVTGLSEDGETLICAIVDLDNSTGEIINEELIKGIWTKNLIPYLCDGDCIRDAVVVENEDNHYLFSIRDAYQAYARRIAEKDARDNIVMEAVVLEIKNDWYGGRITWISPSGYGGVSFPLAERELRPGDKVIMSIQNIQSSGSSFFINLSQPKYSYDSVDRLFESEDEVLAQFVTTAACIRNSVNEKEKDESHQKDEETIRLLAAILANRAAKTISLNSYKQKLASLFLLNLIGDKESFAALLPETYYLRRCISFAQGNKVPLNSPCLLPDNEAMILRLLSMWDGQDQDLLNVVATVPENSVSGKIGALLLGLRISSRFKDEFETQEDLVRKKICELLAVGDLFCSNVSLKTGKYGRTENREVEFKSSYIYRNDNKGADIDYQGRGQVFEAVCGLLNAEGGTVYIGVKDNGDPIVAEDSGLYADIKWLKSNYKFLNGIRSRQLGHAICEVKDFDSYVQFLNSEKELYFKESLLGNIIIEVTEDADAIMITVKPSEYEIAYLFSDKTHGDGRAYVRDGGRTIEMTRVQKERRLATLKDISKEMGFVVAIQEAIDKHGKLLFKGYASGNSGEVKDRLVVPVNLFYNDENVYCYDLIYRKYKQFRLHRISSIEVVPGTYTLQKTSPKKADVFRWLEDGGRQYHIKLRMDVGARNYLLEEYSCAEQLPPCELYEEKKDKWILDTRVNGLGAVRRFYLGLADKIEILDTEDSDELKISISDFVRKNISM